MAQWVGAAVRTALVLCSVALWVHVVVLPARAACGSSSFGYFASAVTADNASLATCPSINETCCAQGKYYEMSSFISLAELLTGDNTNYCYQYIRQWVCLQCSPSAASFLNGTRVTLCHESCETLRSACSTFLFARVDICSPFEGVSTCANLTTALPPAQYRLV